MTKNHSTREMLNRCYLRVKQHFDTCSFVIRDPTNREAGFGVSTAVTIVAVTAGITVLAAWLWSSSTDFAKNVLAGILRGVSNILLYTGSGIADFSAWLLDKVLQAKFLNEPITSNPSFLLGWGTVRNITNMLIVLSFVVVGIATALRIRDYEAKKLLVPLIVCALLINFSGIFVGLMIDASNIAMKTFLNKGANKTATEMTARIWASHQQCMNDPAKPQPYGCKQWQALIEQKPEYSGYGTYIAWSASYFLIYSIIGITFIFLGITLVARQAVLAILFILAPMAFFFRIFDFTKKWWSQWLDALFKWGFIGVIGSFFVYIAWNMLEGLTPKPQTFELLVIAIMLFVGFRMTSKSTGLASMAGAAVLGAVTGGAGLAMGMIAKGGKAGAKMVDKASGNRISGAGQRISDGTGRVMERLGLRTEGTVAQRQANRARDLDKQVSALLSAPSNSADRARGEKLVRDGRGALGAAAVNAANERGELGTILGNNMARINQRVTEAGAYGYERKGFEEKNWRLAGMDESKVRRELNAMGVTGAGNVAQITEARSRANMKQLEKNWSSMSLSDRSNVTLGSFHEDHAREFILGKHGGEYIEALRSVPANPTLGALGAREQAIDHFQRLIVGDNASSATGDLTTVANGHALGMIIDEELARARASGDVSSERRLMELRRKAYSFAY